LRASNIVTRIAELALVAAGVIAIESLRPGGGLITIVGVAAGYLLWVATLRRWLTAVVAAAVILAAGAVVRNGLPPRAQSMIEGAARYHRGHVFTPGHWFKLLDQRFYSEIWGPLKETPMTPDETARFLARATVAFVTIPLPTDVESKGELAFMPEQLVWYGMVLLFPFGLVAGFRRDPALTALLAGYSAVAAGIIAINSGNVGTLVRHRALVIPYMVWVSALGLSSALTTRRSS
jgi:hypothetical protein